MKKYLFTFLLAFAISSAFAFKPVTAPLTGYISDAMCAGKGGCTSPDRVTCAAKCIKGGSAAVFVVGKKVYKISNQKAVVKYAGKKVTLDGKITGETIEVTKVTVAKS